MARPRSFDIDDATEDAMQVFRQQGYDEAGLTELLDAMGIVRGSFYKAFGSKQALFLRVLERYDASVVQGGVTLLSDATIPGRDRIALFFEAGLAAIRDGDRRGCLLCNTAAGPVLDDEDVRDAVVAQLDRLAFAMEAALADHHLLDDTRAAEARRLLMLYVGMQVMGRGAFDPQMLAAAVQPLTAPLGTSAGTSAGGTSGGTATPTLQ